MEPKTCGIYKITNTVNGKFYIGSSSNIDARRKRHIRQLRTNSHDNIHLQRAWDLYGEQKFVFEIIEKCKPGIMLEREQWHLDSVTLSYNISRHTQAFMLGIKRPKSFGERISAMKKGNKYFEGKTHSPEARKRISKAMMGNMRNVGRKHSEDFKRKLSEANTGKRHSEETKKKMGIAVVQLTKNGEFIATYDTRVEAAVANNMKGRHIGSCCSGKRRTSGGYMWMHAIDYRTPGVIQQLALM